MSRGLIYAHCWSSLDNLGNPTRFRASKSWLPILSTNTTQNFRQTRWRLPLHFWIGLQMESDSNCILLALLHCPKTPHHTTTPQILNFSLAILAPSTLALIFANATSLATSGPPCSGFTSMLNGLNPQSSVAPSLCGGMYFAAVMRASQTSSGVSTRGFSGFITPMKTTWTIKNKDGLHGKDRSYLWNAIRVFSGIFAAKPVHLLLC